MILSRRSALATGAAGLVAATTRTARADTPTIRIGVLTDLSGQYRDNSGPTTVLAAKQAVEDFNPSAHGFAVEIISADHQQKPDIAVGVARQWFDRDQVDAIADLNNTAIALAVNGVAVEKNKALLISGAASADITGKYCSPNLVHFSPDTWFDSHSTGGAIVKEGGKDWYLIVADYTFGHALADEVTKVVTGGGGKVLGRAPYPFPGTTDYSSFLLQAQASGAKVVGLCNTGGDMENCVKQAAEFNLAQQGIKIAALVGFITEVKSMGLETAQGLLISGTFYWDLNDRTRAFTKRFLPKTPDNYPSALHASCYAAVTQYLKGVAALGPAKARAGKDAIDWMKANPTDDDCFGKASIRADGRFICNGYLFQVKKPSESKMPWDVFNVVSTTPADKAFRPMSEGGCKLVHA
ncbi:MAG: ABC transporter permease [Rhodospirillales bacterium 69-11]|nr:ABC transporter substrate-binding protein [Rhodospirillales bacterium]OJW21435.1 MAG: ABC transporter permease [Rhodospirillales bacterium 69-11]